MIYQLEIDDRDETARAVLDFIRHIAETNKAIKPPIPVSNEPASQGKDRLVERPLGTMKGSFHLAPDFNEPLDDLKEYM